jgi:hypothetical protein
MVSKTVRRWLTLVALVGLSLGITAPAHAGEAATIVGSGSAATGGTPFVLTTALDPFATPGVTIVNQTVKVPGSSKVMYISVSAVAFTTTSTGGFAWECLLDGVKCNSGHTVDSDGDALPSGWFEALSAAGTFQADKEQFGPQAVTYQWCATIDKTKTNLHTVKIQAANDAEFADGVPIFLEGVQWKIEANQPVGFNKENTACVHL